MSTTRLQEVQICFGFGKQTDIATANLVAAMWRLKKLNAQLANPKLNTENDAEEYGKGHEFATTTFKTSWDTGGTLEKYLSAASRSSGYTTIATISVGSCIASTGAIRSRRPAPSSAMRKRSLAGSRRIGRG